MSLKTLTPDEVKKAEETVCRIYGVSSCRISTADTGAITEIHVVTTADKSPKLIARDVDTCLRAEMDLDVDYRKIGVVLVDPALTTPAPAAVPDPSPRNPSDSAVVSPKPAETVVEFPVEEYASRFAFGSVNVYVSDEVVRAEVELTRDGDSFFGSAQTDKPTAYPFNVIAEAALEAASEHLDESARLCFVGVRRVALDDADSFVVGVDLITGRDRKALVGAAVVSGNENQTVVFATLDAVNRVLGKLDFKSAVEYKIK